MGPAIGSALQSRCHPRASFPLENRTLGRLLLYHRPIRRRLAIAGSCGPPFRRAASHEKVKWVATLPGEHGAGAAFAAEFLILFSLLLTIHFPILEPWIGVVAGVHLCAFITFEAPFSGMSLNPARTVASALPARSWTALWVYFVAPPAANVARGPSLPMVRG